jgi:uncharacterized membrane protein
MWTRKELKTKAKASLNANYWKTVLVSFICALVLGGTGVVSSLPISTTFSFNTNTTQQAADNTRYYVDPNDESKLIIESEGDRIVINGNEAANDRAHALPDVNTTGPSTQSSAIITINGEPLNLEGILAALVAGLAAMLAMSSLIGTLIDIFLINPFEVGSLGFFVHDLSEPAEITDLKRGFDSNYLNSVKIMFIRDLKLFAWSLLLFVPGIIKGYEYRMVPYILANERDITTKEAFARSKEMMTGNKWKAFVFDLSFIGWHLLSALTLGILELFFVHPYQNLANAALYERLNGHEPYEFEPVTGPAPIAGAEGAVEPVAEDAAEPVAEGVAEPVAEDAAVAGTAAEPAAETADVAVAEAAAEPVTEAAVEPATDAVAADPAQAEGPDASGTKRS